MKHKAVDSWITFSFSTPNDSLYNSSAREQDVPAEREKYKINQTKRMIVWDASEREINDEIRIEDYLGASKAKPNRFDSRMKDDPLVAVIDPAVAKVFPPADMVMREILVPCLMT